MVRLSFRDIWWYCYLEQTHLDSSFFRPQQNPFRGRKSQDAMRFFTGLHLERLSQLETDLYRTIDEQQGKREAVRQIRQVRRQFDLGSELDVAAQIEKAGPLSEAEERRNQLQSYRFVSILIHPRRLRAMGVSIMSYDLPINATEDAIGEQRALRAELITTKVKADRTEHAGHLLDDVEYTRCPECGTESSNRAHASGSVQALR